MDEDVQHLEFSCFANENENGWKFLRKVNLFLANDLTILLPGIYPKEMKTYAYTKSYIW